MGVTFDSSKWKCLLFRFDDGTYDIDIQFEAENDPDEALTPYALDIAMCNLIGEKAYILKVENIRRVDDFEQGHENKVIPFDALKDILTDTR